MNGHAPELELYVVSEFPPPQGRWIPYHIERSFRDNLASCRAALSGKRIALAGIIAQPHTPYWRMRLIPFLLAPLQTLVYNENLDHFMLRPRSAPTIARHLGWRVKNFLRWQLNPGGGVYTFLWRVRHPKELRRPLLYRAALAAGRPGPQLKSLMRPLSVIPQRGISVVVPSRNGRELVAGLLAGLTRELDGIESEIIVVDNGSDDGTAAWLGTEYPWVIVEQRVEALSFARAVNAGIERSRYSHVCLLNNDMILRPGFFAPLLNAFERVPNLFCATAQIFFPEGMRREETGKAVWRQERSATDFPVYCVNPVKGEDLTYVLYGSGGCSLYDTAKLRALGMLDEIYDPAYVEDLDLGYRGWRRGWPTVFAAGAQLVHMHRATTSRYYSQEDLECAVEVNYLRFLVRCVQDRALFKRLWWEAVSRLNLLAVEGSSAALNAMRLALHARQWARPQAPAAIGERIILAVGDGSVAVFPGQKASDKPRVLIASPYVPFPLAHGGAVRMYNLMRRAARDFDLILMHFTDELSTPPPELAEICCEIVQVRRVGTHLRRSSDLPDAVIEFESAAFRGALRLTIGKWKPTVAQLEFTQMAQYARDCAPAKTVLVEHDITLDLYAQLLAAGEDWETRRQHERWLRFEPAAWREVDCVVTMSDIDRGAIKNARCVEALANGVDIERFRPSGREPEPARLLFIGSFAHLPNVMALEFFLREVWPRLAEISPVLHVIAGSRHEYYLERYSDRVVVDLRTPGVEIEGFVSDVRPSYERASVVVAPLVASAGTNIKIMEAMAMGKAVVSTAAGVNGLDVVSGREAVVVGTGEEMAREIIRLICEPQRRRELEHRARAAAETGYNWDIIAARQAEMYRKLGAI